MKTACVLLVFLGPLVLLATPPSTHRQRVASGQSEYRTYQPSTGYYVNGSYHNPSARVRSRRVDIVTVQQINPAYTSAYSPEGYDSVTQADILGEIRRLNVRIDQLTALAKAAPVVVIPGKEGVPPVVVPPTVVVPPVRKPAEANGAVGLSIMVAKCAACHQAGKLLPDQKFTLIDVKGNLVSLTDKQKLNVLHKTFTGQMPPPNNVHGIPPLTDAEYAAIAELVN